jgi:hypothetical protein
MDSEDGEAVKNPYVKNISLFLLLVFIVTSFRASFAAEKDRLAYLKLNELAENHANGRKTASWILAGACGLEALLLAGSDFSSWTNQHDASNFKSYGLTLTAVGIALAYAGYLTPTEIELARKKVSSMPSSTEDQLRAQELEAENVLKTFSEKYSSSRISSSPLLVVGGALLLGSSPVLGIGLIGMGIASYISKSDVEVVYDDYRAQKTDGGNK